ncbi:hypothetical protein [Campylobacter sp. RM16187]|uniref:hypothetical protein n=1 Tax=Campylobacter sp. RM16187 TaxID=1660063 RepID=UPI0021B57A5D|nr:hypothetical protein [Campylobacter sp. RM16187]QKG30262.1 hypothetical protein CDOMF_a013 [Campylobacter sp. RM16187]
MKKIVVSIAILLSFSQSLFACLCAGEIVQSFKQYEMELKRALKAQQNSLKNLQSKVDDTTSNLDEQNILISNENELFKATILKQRELIFELTKKINLR